MELIDRKLQGFDIKELNSFVRILGILIDANIMPGDAVRYIKLRQIIGDLNAYYGCKYCAHAMELMAVNTLPCNQVGGKYKSMWHCDRCGEYELSELDTDYEVSRAIVVRHIIMDRDNQKPQEKKKQCGGCKDKQKLGQFNGR